MMARASILLLIIDCLRADHCSAYGYSRPTTPTLEDLAKRGILWEQATSASSWTKPAVASLLTGTYPTEHGAFQGVKRSRGQAGAVTDAIRAGMPTLAERLSACGWRCGAFVNNAQLGEFSGVHRGFSDYHPAAGKADHLIERFRDWLEAEPERPFFAYLHLLEAHWPYKPRRRHMQLFGGDRDTNCFRDFSARDYGRLRKAISRGEATLSASEREQMVQMYDAAVRRLDGKLKALVRLLEHLNLLDRTAVFVTADHGEAFLDHGRIGHGQDLHEELVHVPLVASIPDGPCGVRRPEPVSLVDFAPTVADLVGFEFPGSGESLMAPAADRPVFAELLTGRRYTQAIRRRQWKLHRELLFDPSRPDEGSRGSPFSWTCTRPFQVRHQLYDLAQDPGEQVNLADRPDCAGRRAELVARLERWWHEAGSAFEEDPLNEVDIDASVMQRLRDLGYID